MSSNEEYLDSLLKAVTAEDHMENQDNLSDEKINMENNLQEETQGVSEDELDKMLGNVANLDVNEITLDSGMSTVSEEEEDFGIEEKAFSDPGALFFEGEEEEMEEPFLAIEDFPEQDEESNEESIMTENFEETNVETDDDGEENLIEEEDIIGAADRIEEEDIIGAADQIEEEDIIGAADQIEESFDDEGFKEINELLASSGDGDDEMLAMLEGVENETNASVNNLFDEEEPEEAVVTEKQDKKKKEKKRKTKKKDEKSETTIETEESAKDGTEEKGKKNGIFARFINFLLEDDEEEENEKADDQAVNEEAVGETTDENKAILDELDKEDKKKKSNKKDKKKDKKKGKKGKGADGAEDGEEGEETEEKEKKAKKEKKKKKKEKVEQEVEQPGKKISGKKIRVTVVFCFSLLAAILLAVYLIPPTLGKNSARDAYYAKDYEKVIEGFYGEDLSASDDIMYHRAYIILRLQRKIDGYNNYMRMGKETEALNQLIEGVIRYRDIYAEAEEYNVTGEVDTLYQKICDALQNKYGLTVQDAEALYVMEDKLAYTLKLESIINGTEYVAPETMDETEQEPEE